MDVIEKYFRKQSNKVSFVELKIENERYKEFGLVGIPLPLIVEEMVEGISSKDFENQIDLKYIVKGIFYILAIDPEFLYISEYKNILSKTIKEPSKYALSLMNDMISKNSEDAILFARAAFLLDEKNELAATYYANFLWKLDVSKEEKHIFVEQSVRILERILHYNENSAPANYELGNIFSNTGDFIKANSFYVRALNSAEDEYVKEDIRSNIERIAPDVAVENAIYYINRADNSNAIEILMEARKQSNRYDISYYLAIAYMNQENIQLAEQFFEEAIEKGADFAMLYTDYVYVKYILRKFTEAIDIATDALERYPAELKLRYNRAVIYISQNKMKKALEDVEFILEYQDLSDEFFNQVMKLKEIIGG